MQQQRIYLLVLDPSMKVHVEAVELATLTADLPNLTYYIELISDTEIILEEKKYQAVVEILSEKNKQNPIPTYLGSLRAGCPAIGWLKQLDPDKSIRFCLYRFKSNAYRLFRKASIY